MDVDLASNFPSCLMVERENHCFPIEVIYQNMCENCGMVGHTIDRCKHITAHVKNSHSKEAVEDAPVKAKSKRHTENGKHEYRLKARTPNNPPTENVKQAPLLNSMNVC